MQSHQQTSNHKRAILYYPTISIPTNDWLRRSLLYWDEIGSIVPVDYEENTLIPYSPDIQFLVIVHEAAAAGAGMSTGAGRPDQEAAIASVTKVSR